MTKDNITINLLEGNESSVNRSSGYVRLSVYIYDQDSLQNTTEPDQIHFWITNDTVNWLEEIGWQKDLVEVSYFLNFDPDCNYSANKQKWQVNLTNSNYYFDSRSEDYYVNVTGDLNATILTPTGNQNFTRPAIITIVGHVEDDCLNPVIGANIYFNLTTGSKSFRCPEVGYASDLGNGNYSCDFNTTEKPAVFYNITMFAEKSYHNPDKDFISNAFYLKVIPELFAADVEPNTEGWSVLRTFTVNITDIGDNVTVWLWRSKSLTGPWIQIGSEQYCYDCNNSQLIWQEDYLCEETGYNISTWYFKFNASDTEGNNYETQSGDYAENNYYDVTKDDVTFIHISGNDTNVTKTTSSAFVIRIYDSDKGDNISIPVAKVNLEVTLNNSDIWLSEASSVQTNSSGYFNYDFYGSCKYDPGYQKWRVIIDSVNDRCYQSGYSDNYTVYLDIACPEFNITQVLYPEETFQFNPFAVNATLRIKDRNATNTNITLHAPLNWNILPSSNLYLDKIIVGLGETVYTPVQWGVNATTLTSKEGIYYLNVSANTTDEIPPINYYEDEKKFNLTTYERFEIGCPSKALINSNDYSQKVCNFDGNAGEDLDNITLEAEVLPGDFIVLIWNCGIGDIRVSEEKIYWEGLNGSTTARLEIYSPKEWRNIYEEWEVGENISEAKFQQLSDIISLTSDGKCMMKIFNTGDVSLLIDYANGTLYYIKSVKITDIQTVTDGNYYNESIIIVNPFLENYTNVNLELNLTDGTTTYYSNSTLLNLTENETVVYTFYNINLANLDEGEYEWVATLTYDSKVDQRVEKLYHYPPKKYVRVPRYMCPSSSDKITIELQKLEEESDINISVEVPSGWQINPAYRYFHEYTGKEVYAEFEITSSSVSENVTINISYFISYP
ncbi:MAG: hypothetical protein DRP11_05175, partial [Candidatus Aenigmatarchaeota archaeon]